MGQLRRNLHWVRIITYTYIIIQTWHANTHTHTHTSLAVTAGSGGLHTRVAEQEAVMERQGKEVIELRSKLDTLVKRAKEQSELMHCFPKTAVFSFIMNSAAQRKFF